MWIRNFGTLTTGVTPITLAKSGLLPVDLGPVLEYGVPFVTDTIAATGHGNVTISVTFTYDIPSTLTNTNMGQSAWITLTANGTA